MALELDIQVDSTGADRSLDRSMASMEPTSLSAFLREEGVPWLQRRAEARFSTEGDAASGPWAPLLPATNRARRAMGYPPAHPINRRTGDLRRWVIDSEGVHTRSAQMARVVWPGVADGDIATKYQTAQKGKKSRRGNGTVPRPAVAADEVDLRFMLSGIGHWIAALSDIRVT